MSKSQVSRTKAELEMAGLIKIETRSLAHGHFPGHIITIVDIWKENIDHYDNNSPVSSRDASCLRSGIRPVPVVGHKNIPLNKNP
jgi:hypothetical protein